MKKLYFLLALCLPLFFLTSCKEKTIEYSSGSNTTSEIIVESYGEIMPVFEKDFIDYYIIPLLQAGLTNESWSTKKHVDAKKLTFFYSLNYLYPNLEDAEKTYTLSENESSVFVPVEDIVLCLNTYFDNITEEMLIKDNSNYSKENHTIEISIGGIGSSPYPTIQEIDFIQTKAPIVVNIVTKSPFDDSLQDLSVVLVSDVSNNKYYYQSLTVE